MSGLATTFSGGVVAAYVLTCFAHKDVGLFMNMLTSLPYFMLILAALEISNIPIEKVGYRRSKTAKLGEFVLMAISVLCILTRSFPEFLFFAPMSVLVYGFGNVFANREVVFGEIREARKKFDEENNDSEENPDAG